MLLLPPQLHPSTRPRNVASLPPSPIHRSMPASAIMTAAPTLRIRVHGRGPRLALPVLPARFGGRACLFVGLAAISMCVVVYDKTMTLKLEVLLTNS